MPYKDQEKIKQYHKEWSEKNREKIYLYRSEYHKKNKEKIKTGMKAYSENNKERIKARRKSYYLKNRDKIRAKVKNYSNLNRKKINARDRAYGKIYRKNNKDKIRVVQREYVKERRQTDINFRLKGNLRARINDALKNNYKSKSTTELLGCSLDEFKLWLESQFQDGMSWDNYGQWHLDHVYPSSKFDLSQPYEQKICFNWFNLQPLWARENIVKSNKINI